MIYNAEQKIYFQLQTVMQILEDIDCEVYDLAMSKELDEAKHFLEEISTAAYKKAGESD